MVIGSLAALVADVIGSTIMGSVGSILVGEAYPFGPIVWLIKCSSLFVIVVGAAVGALHRLYRGDHARMIATEIATAFVVVVLSEAVGAVAVNSFRYGWDRVNASGYIQASGFYGNAPLPLGGTLGYLVALMVDRFARHIRCDSQSRMARAATPRRPQP